MRCRWTGKPGEANEGLDLEDVVLCTQCHSYEDPMTVHVCYRSDGSLTASSRRWKTTSPFGDQVEVARELVKTAAG